MMAAEGKNPPPVSKAAAELFKSQGIQGFYRGIEANVMRAMVLNGTKMACYDQIKVIDWLIILTFIFMAVLPFIVVPWLQNLVMCNLPPSAPSPYNIIATNKISHGSQIFNFIGHYCEEWCCSRWYHNAVLRCFWCWILHGNHRGAFWHGAHKAHEPAARRKNL